MSSESLCQVAHSWVDMGIFHTHLFGVMNVACGDFHDALEKGTASVHQILCQSWEKCYRHTHNDSTSPSLRGPKLESCAGVSTACPVQDRSHISWWWRTHRETHKLHNWWNCCTNSRAHPSGSMLDHSWHCWGGGNWLWDMPTDSDGRIGHAPCRSQICAQDSAADQKQQRIIICTELNWTEKQNVCHPPPTVLPWFGTLWFLPISQNGIEAERTLVWYHWGDTDRIAESAWHTDRKGLRGSVPKMEEVVEPVSTCGRELLRGWRWPIGLMVSFTIFTASVSKTLDTTLYMIIVP